jgi:hypothetical protein
MVEFYVNLKMMCIMLMLKILFLLFFFFWFLVFFKTVSPCVVQASFEPTILLSQAPECGNYKHVSPCSADKVSLNVNHVQLVDRSLWVQNNLTEFPNIMVNLSISPYSSINFGLMYFNTLLLDIYIKNFMSLCVCTCVVLEMEPRALNLPGNCSVTELHPQRLSDFLDN